MHLVDPRHIAGENLDRVVRCGKDECGESMLVRDVFVWCFLNEDKWHYRGFCSNTHALMCMTVEVLHHA